jgi:integrase
MQHSRTFGIIFWINTSRIKNDEAKIYARITVNQKRVNISLKYDVAVNRWDNFRSRVIGNDEKTRMINHYLDQVYTKLFRSYQQLNAEDKPITAKAIKNRYLGIDDRHYSMQNLIDYHNKTMEHRLQRGTMNHYYGSQKYILMLIKKSYKTSDMYLKDITYSFIIEFENMLRSHNQGSIANNTVMKHIQRLRKMITMAHHMEWIDKDPFAKFKGKHEKVERGFLTRAELTRIEELPYSVERIQTAKDLFIFSCYTGIAYGDLMRLTKDNVVHGIDGYKWITTRRQKNGNPVKIPLLPKALSLIEIYKAHPKVIGTRTLFPKMFNQKLNNYLKEIATLCSINKRITFHMARHTFATTITLSNGVPIETVSKILGHTKISTTQIYAKVVERKVSDDMFILREKLSQNKIANV